MYLVIIEENIPLNISILGLKESSFGRPEPSRTSTSLDYNNRKQFTGQREDRTGLHYYGARYYCNNIRLFTQPDPQLPIVNTYKIDSEIKF